MALSADIIRLHFLLPIDTADARLFALAYADGNLKHSVVWWILFIFLAICYCCQNILILVCKCGAATMMHDVA